MRRVVFLVPLVVLGGCVLSPLSASADQPLPYSTPVSGAGLPAGEVLTVQAPVCNTTSDSTTIRLGLSGPVDPESNDVTIESDDGSPDGGLSQWYTATWGAVDIRLPPGTSRRIHLVFQVSSVENGVLVTNTYATTPTFTISSCDHGVASPSVLPTATPTSAPASPPTDSRSSSPTDRTTPSRSPTASPAPIAPAQSAGFGGLFTLALTGLGGDWLLGFEIGAALLALGGVLIFGFLRLKKRRG